jgi:hypothetical protein
LLLPFCEDWVLDPPLLRAPAEPLLPLLPLARVRSPDREREDPPDCDREDCDREDPPEPDRDRDDPPDCGDPPEPDRDRDDPPDRDAPADLEDPPDRDAPLDPDALLRVLPLRVLWPPLRVL